MQYRFRIPVCGAIILNSNLDKCVLVKGWSSKLGWGFPKGKINQEEEYDCCAVREVLEETGYDIGPLLKKSDYIELTMREQRIRLYIIYGVPEDTQFIPRTRKEISQISWIKLDDLPTFKTTDPRPGNGSLNYVKSGPYRFYMVVPFINKLRHFVNQRKKTLKKDHNKAERLMKGSASPLKQSNLPSASSPKQPAESSNALKSLLGVGPESITTEAKFAASPAVSQPQPNHQPPINGNNLLQQLFASSSNQQSPQQQQPQAQYSPQQQYMQHPQQYGHQQVQQHPHQQNDILQQLQQATMMQQHQQSRPEQQQQQQNGNAHRASFVEELLKTTKEPQLI
ncbi:unnamed protein product [Mucor hiemalis]